MLGDSHQNVHTTMNPLQRDSNPGGAMLGDFHQNVHTTMNPLRRESNSGDAKHGVSTPSRIFDGG
jgi:hypothetical protein